MSKTIRSTSRPHTEHDSFESQLSKVKQKIVSNKADVFMQMFRISEYSVDTVFPNQFNETVEQYVERNIKNYTVIIDRLKEMVTVLVDPLSGRPIAGEFNWILLAIDHHVEIDDDLFSMMSVEQKSTLLQKLIDESEIRLTMLKSIPVPMSFVSLTPESEITMNANTTNENIDQINDVINSAALNGAKHIEQAAQEATDTVKQATEKVAEAVSDATKKVASKPAEEAAKPATESSKFGWKKAAKYASITAATVGAVAGGYWLYKNKFAGSIGGALSSATDLASEQVVGG